MPTSTSTPTPAAGFFQEAPRLGNQFHDDPLLASALARLLGPEVLAEVAPQLERLGARAVGDLAALGDGAEATPPRHVPFDAWGRRVDRVEVSAAWRALAAAAAEEGLVATGYERRFGERSRIVQHALLYLWGPPTAIYLCPLAMTDGAARLVETQGDADLRERVLPRLLSRDPSTAWTSGQWMTERTGGSDVSATETVAVPDGGSWRLWGTKWFTSAVESQVAFTLARPEGAPPGSRGLQLFYVELGEGEDRLRHVRVERLKDKLGTRALPTAELALEGQPARPIGGVGEGVRRITTLMNVTRVYNANGAVGLMRRGLALARDYAGRRRAFGRLLLDHPLHRESLADLQADVAAGLLLLLRTAALAGREEIGLADGDERAQLRLLTPLVKLFTGKRTVAAASEVLECFGGAGYVEDTGLPRLLRDAQVLAIWEGTTNVLALDVLRAADREGALGPTLADVARRLAALPDGPWHEAAQAARDAHAALVPLADALAEAGEAARQALARRFAFSLARLLAGSLLLEQAAWSAAAGEPVAGLWLAASRRWCARLSVPVLPGAEELAAGERLAGGRVSL